MRPVQFDQQESAQAAPAHIILAGATGDTAPIMSVSQFAMDA
jgi:hypothetical protein